jgi:hypothetical protein
MKNFLKIIEGGLFMPKNNIISAIGMIVYEQVPNISKFLEKQKEMTLKSDPEFYLKEDLNRGLEPIKEKIIENIKAADQNDLLLIIFYDETMDKKIKETSTKLSDLYDLRAKIPAVPYVIYNLPKDFIIGEIKELWQEIQKNRSFEHLLEYLDKKTLKLDEIEDRFSVTSSLLENFQSSPKTGWTSALVGNDISLANLRAMKEMLKKELKNKKESDAIQLLFQPEKVGLEGAKRGKEILEKISKGEKVDLEKIAADFSFYEKSVAVIFFGAFLEDDLKVLDEIFDAAFEISFSKVKEKIAEISDRVKEEKKVEKWKKENLSLSLLIRMPENFKGRPKKMDGADIIFVSVDLPAQYDLVEQIDPAFKVEKILIHDDEEEVYEINLGKGQWKWIKKLMRKKKYQKIRELSHHKQKDK